MIKPVELLRVLDSHHVLYILHHTNRTVISARVTTDRTHLAVTDVVTHLAALDLFLHFADGIRQQCHVLFFLTQQMEHQS